MDLANDPELIELYRSEMAERVEALWEGSSAMASDSFPVARLEEMRREAHTVKGTSRVMGMNEPGDAGELIEDLFTEIQKAKRVPSIGLGRGLVLICEALKRFLADPMSDHQLTDALEVLAQIADDPLAADSLLGEVKIAEGEVEASTSIEASDEAETGDNVIPIDHQGASPGFLDVAPNPRSNDPLLIPMNLGEVANYEDVEDAIAEDDRSRTLGGLLEAPEMWINSETTGVATLRLYEIINRAAELRLDTESLLDAMERVAAIEDPAAQQAMFKAMRYGINALAVSAQAMQRQTIALVAVPMRSVLSSLPALVRFLAKRTEKDLRFEMIGDEDIELDRGTLDRVADIIRQLLVNAIVHGLHAPSVRKANGKDPTGTLTLAVEQIDDRVRVVVTDDGSGIDWPRIRRLAQAEGILDEDANPSTAELQAVLFNELISTSSPDDELSGSGAGLSKVAESVLDLHGSVELRSVPKAGTEVEIMVPRFQSLQSIVLVMTASGRWGIPELAILDRTSVADAITYRTPDGRKELLFRDGTIPLVPLSRLVGDTEQETIRDVIVVSTHSGPLALSVAGTLGVMEVAPKRLGGLLRSAPFVTGAAMVGGELAMLIDTEPLMEVVESLDWVSEDVRKTILVVDDSPGVRQVLSAALTADGFDAVVAASAEEALEQLANHSIDGMVVDFAMPEQDGVELVNNVRATYGAIPVVMLSGVAAEDDIARAEAAGIDAFFEKSDFREGALTSMLISLLDNELKKAQ